MAKSPELGAIRAARLTAILESIPVLAFDAASAEAYGRILGVTGWTRGRDFDRMISAHAIATRRALVTANIADFRDIAGLRIEDWTTVG